MENKNTKSFQEKVVDQQKTVTPDNNKQISQDGFPDGTKVKPSNPKSGVKSAMVALLMLFAIGSNAQNSDTVSLTHKAYVSVFAKSSHIPVMVYYTLHDKDLNCKTRVPRSNNFKADPLLAGTNLGADYDKSGYDQGHNMSAQDNMCDATCMNECFYFTNMFPQTPNLNRGVWKKLEVEERTMASLYGSIVVYIGSYQKDKTIGPDKVVVPGYCWKVIYLPTTNTWFEYIFPNADSCPGDPSNYMKINRDQHDWMQYCVKRWSGNKIP